MSALASDSQKPNKVRSLLRPVKLKSAAALLLGACSGNKATPHYEDGADGGFDGFPEPEEVVDAGADAGADAGPDGG